MQLPEATMVTVSPDAVHTEEVDEAMVGAAPDVALATTLNCDDDHVRGPGFVNEIVLDNF